MRVGITTSGSDCGRSGIGRYLQNLLRSMVQTAGRPELELLASRTESAIFDPGHPGISLTQTGQSVRAPIPDILWHLFALPGRSLCRRYDVLFLPAANRRLPYVAPCPTVGVVHDLSALHVPGKYGSARDVYIRRVLPLLIRRLDHVITVSESTKRDVLEYAGVREDRVSVIPLAADRATFWPRERTSARSFAYSNYGLDRPYFLYVSRLEHPGKNHVRLIRAFELLKRDSNTPHQLVFCGADWDRAEEIREVAARSVASADIRILGFVPTKALPLLYSAAEASVYPSLYEGFGLPILEAMACGAPVACSDTSSMPEVAGDAALLFDPHEPEAIAAAMSRLISDSELRGRLSIFGQERASRYSWDRTAVRTLDVITRTARQAA